MNNTDNSNKNWTLDECRTFVKDVTRQGFRAIYLYLTEENKLEPLGKYASKREIPLTTLEIDRDFSDPSITSKIAGVAFALRGKGHRSILIDLDGKDAIDVFWNEFLPLLPKDIQDKIRKAPRTSTKRGGLHILLRIDENFTGIRKQNPKWSGITIVGTGGNTSHSEINVLGTEHISRDWGSGYSTIISIESSKIRFSIQSIDLILKTLEEFKKATNAIRTATDILMPFWKSEPRDIIVFDISGLLGNGKVPKELTIRLFNQIHRVADLSDDNLKHTVQVIKTTYEKIENGERVLGFEGLKEIIKNPTLIDEIQGAFKTLGYFPDYFNGATAAINDKGYNETKKAILTIIGDSTIRDMLISDVWTMTSENPLKFIVARKKACNISRASIAYSESGNNQSTKKAHLNYGSILIRLFPKQITLHESPLKFLEMSERYTIVFENQAKHEVVLSGTIESIISRLKEMPGYVISPYGISEALTAIIGAFKDDNRLLIDKTVDFEGYYYNDNDVQISKIDLDVKHPRRTKQEVIDCIKYLEKRSEFQIWNDKQGNKIDRRDLLASLIQWIPASPFNFLLKQQNSRPYLKGFALTGERDGAKTTLSTEMLNAHGNLTNDQDADSIYSVSAGSVNTEAKFGRAVSRTTYAVEFSDFGRAESYGRHEDLVECFKTSVDGTILRRGKKENRTDAPFPSLSPLIINGNPPFTSKGELLKRYHIAKFTEDDRHDRSPNSDFNKFQRENSHHWKILGDWTVRYILDNKQELLLSKKYGAMEIGRKALEAFYEYGGVQVPEWLTRWISETALEELDEDIEGIIRSIFYDKIHKTIRENPDFVNREDIKQGIEVNMPERLDKCLESKVWSWIKKIERKNDTKYHIYGSIMEVFSQRLPELTFQKLAQKMGLQYINTHGKRKIVCTKVELDNFLTNEEG